jgi:hypothetical protein
MGLCFGRFLFLAFLGLLLLFLAASGQERAQGDQHQPISEVHGVI